MPVRGEIGVFIWNYAFLWQLVISDSGNASQNQIMEDFRLHFL